MTGKSSLNMVQDSILRPAILISLIAIAATVMATTHQKSRCDGAIAALGGAQGISFAATATYQAGSDCERLLEALQTAQSNYDKAVGLWKQSENFVIQAEAELSEIQKKLNENDKKGIAAEAALEKAQADQKACDASGNLKNPLMPLTCSEVPSRIQKAQKDIADAKATSANLEAEEAKWKKEVENREDARAAAHQRQLAASQELEAAQQAYAECGAFWVGTITHSYKYRSNPVDKPEAFPGGDGGINRRTRTSDWLTTNTIEASIQPSSGKDSQHLTARVTHTYDRHWHDTRKTDEAEWCRPRGGKSHWERFNNTNINNEDESGSVTTLEPSGIYVDKSKGTFEINLKFAAVSTTTKVELRSTNIGCSGADPRSEIKTTQGSPVSEEYTKSDLYTITGAIDPRNPDILTGKTSAGDLYGNGETTVVWNLRLVKPKKKP
jgi:hypothetical protein